MHLWRKVTYECLLLAECLLSFKCSQWWCSFKKDVFGNIMLHLKGKLKRSWSVLKKMCAWFYHSSSILLRRTKYLEQQRLASCKKTITYSHFKMERHICCTQFCSWILDKLSRDVPFFTVVHPCAKRLNKAHKKLCIKLSNSGSP